MESLISKPQTLNLQVGKKLPAAFMGTLEEQGSPYYSFNTGVAIALGTMFVLGILATRAEPALNVLGQTVEKLTKGSFTKNMLIYAVCFGVGTGMTVGATKILFGANSVQTRAHAAAEWAGGGGGVGTPAVVAEEE